VYKLDDIDNELIKSDAGGMPENFVAAAVAVDETGKAYHAGFVIGYKAIFYLFHYTGIEVKLESLPIGEWYFHKSLTFISEDEVSAFYNHCKVIEKDANPTYGYFYSGSYYENGKYFSENGEAEIMTCVTFCLNVILGFIESDEYLTFSDWDIANQIGAYRVYHRWDTPEDKNAEEYIAYFISKFSRLMPDVALEILKRNLRRIYPVEYLSSAFVEKFPIKKVTVDSIVPLVETSLRIKRAG
jgi:hypothetical protein